MNKALLKPLDFIPFILALSFAVILIINQPFSWFTIEGIKMYFVCVLPSLFPLFFISTLLSFLNGTGRFANLISPVTSKVFKINGACGYALFMSLISGYPIGSSLLSEFRSQSLINEAEAERASVICSTSSPAFVISSVGGLMFNDITFGVALYLCHILSSITLGVGFSFYKRKSPPSLTVIKAKSSENVIYDCVLSAVNSALFVGGLIAVFYLLVEVLFSLGLFNPVLNLIDKLLGDKNLSKAIVFGILENTKGVKTASLSGVSRLSFCVCAMLCGFSGLSTIFQSVAFLKKAKIKTAPFLISKILLTVINLIYSLLISLLLF